MISNFLKIFSQTLLFILLFCQGALIYLCLSYQGIPISNSLIQKYVPVDLNFSSKETLFFLPFHIKLTEPEFAQKADTLFQFDSPEIFVSWQPSLKGFNLNNWKIHSYSGQINSKLYPSPLELNRLNLSFNRSQIQNAKVHLRSDDKVICLNYSAKKYLVQYHEVLKPIESMQLQGLLSPSIEQNSSLFSLINAFHASKNSHIECHLERMDLASYSLLTKLSSESIDLYGNKLKSLEIQSQHNSNSEQSIVFFEAADFSNSSIPIQCDTIRGEFKLNDQMQIASIKLGANSSRLKDTALDAISAEIQPRGTDDFIINGMLFHEDHSLNVLTDYQIDAETNAFSIKAYINLNKLQKGYIPELETLKIKSFYPSFVDVEIILGKKLNLLSAQGLLQIEPTTINSTSIEYLRSDFQLLNKRLTTNNSLKINHRTSFINTNFNIESGDYSCSLQGANFSSDFNSILPKWWQNTFKDFSYNNDTKCLHDFSIYGSIESPDQNFLIGSVQTKNLDYKGVLVKYADLLVINKNYCTQITLKDLKTQQGKAEGTIKITKKPDGFNKPESVRTKLKSELTLKTAEKLFGSNTQKILFNFESPNTHTIDFESVFFDPHYTQHKGKSYYNLFIKRTDPILFFSRPFDQLTAKIYGRNNQHFIRSARAEFAGGQLNFEADISDTSSTDPQLRIHLNLSDCDYKQSIKDTFQNEFTNTPIEESVPLDLDLTLKSQGSLLDFTQHNGYGNLTINGPGLGKIHLLGPFSKALDQLNISIGVFSLNHLESNFLIQKEWINVGNLEIDGEESHVFGQGRISIPDQSINFKMEVDLLKNKNLSFSKLGSLGKILNPVAKIFNFTVTGTLQDQKWRSALDPRNLFE